jgi:hypothetical protein
MKAAAPVEKPRRHARWPVVLCALVATCFGTAAFLESPLGAKPEVQQVEPEPPSAKWPEIPPDLEAIILTCLAKAPADRYPDVPRLLADLDRLKA